MVVFQMVLAGASRSFINPAIVKVEMETPTDHSQVGNGFIEDRQIESSLQTKKDASGGE